MRFGMRFVALTLIVVAITAILAQPAFPTTLNADEQDMLDLLNQEREACGLKPLEIDYRLERMARLYCLEMVSYDFFSHTSPVSGNLLDRVVSSDVPDGWLIAGENLAGAPTVELAFKGLMNSPAHKANMLEEEYTHVGIGVVAGGPYGKMFVQEFIAYPKDMIEESGESEDEPQPIGSSIDLAFNPNVSPFLALGYLWLPLITSLLNF